MLTEKEKIETLTHLVTELNQVRDLDILMEHILTQARRFVNADAGSIYIAENETSNSPTPKTIPCKRDCRAVRNSSTPLSACR